MSQHNLPWVGGGVCKQDFVVIHSLSHLPLFVTPWTAACQASLSSTISRSLLKFMSIELMMPSSHLVLCHPLLLLPFIFPIIRVFPSLLSIWWKERKRWWGGEACLLHFPALAQLNTPVPFHCPSFYCFCTICHQLLLFVSLKWHLHPSSSASLRDTIPSDCVVTPW